MSKKNWKSHYFVLDSEREAVEYPTATKCRFAASKRAIEVCKEASLHPVTNRLRHSFVLADETETVVRIICAQEVEIAE